MNRILWVGLVWLFHVSPALAVSVVSEIPLVQSAELSNDSFLAFARAEDRKTLSEFLETDRPQNENVKKLMQLTQRAQTLWLNGQTSEARSIFKEVSALALEDDWRESQREVIAYSRLRLAQSAPTLTEQRDWLEKVAAYASDYRPSQDAFPPPLLSVFEEAKVLARKNSVDLALFDRFPHYRFVLIDGRKFELSHRKKIRVPGGIFRLTALSDSKPPLTETMTAAELSHFRVLTSPLAIGTCATPKISELAGTEFEALYANNCLANHRKSLELKPLGSTSSVATDWPTSEPTSGPSISKRTWWIIGGAAVLAGLALSLQKMNEKKVEPTSKQGF